jgi:hypothetical protein
VVLREGAEVASLASLKKQVGNGGRVLCRRQMTAAGDHGEKHQPPARPGTVSVVETSTSECSVR